MIFQTWLYSQGYTQMYKWLPAINKQKFIHSPPPSYKGGGGVTIGRVGSRQSLFIAINTLCWIWDYYVYQNACYTGLSNVSVTVRISTRTESRSELSADLTGMNVRIQHLCTFSPVFPFTYHLPNVWKVWYTNSVSNFVDIPYWPPYSTDKLSYCVVPGSSQWFFHFGEEIVTEWTQQKTATLVGTDPHHSSWQCKESHRYCCHGILVPMTMGDSGTSTVLTRYKPLPFRSLRQSERNTARDLIQHRIWTYPCYRAVNT